MIKGLGMLRRLFFLCVVLILGEASSTRASKVISPSNITATSATGNYSPPQKSCDGSGLDINGLLHSTMTDDHWVNECWPNNMGNPVGRTGSMWIQYTLNKIYQLNEMWVWNHNELGTQSWVDRGLKKVKIDYSLDGNNWTYLGEFTFARAPGRGWLSSWPSRVDPNEYAHEVEVDFSGAGAKYVCITADVNEGTWGSDWACGLAEVRFFGISAQASTPYPPNTAGDMPPEMVLSWTPGDYAASHEVYFGADYNDVNDANTSWPVGTSVYKGNQALDNNNYDPDGLLELGQTYYWRIDEVNDSNTWKGNIWTFAVKDYHAVDDFQDYNDSNDLAATWVPAGNANVSYYFSTTMEPFFEQHDVFISGMGGYHTYRIPAIVVTNAGTILAFCEGRKNSAADDGDIDLVLRRSLDNGQTWTDTQIVYEEGGSAEITIGNPCPVVDRDTGTIWVFFAKNWGYDGIFVTSSTDDGVTWASPTDLTSTLKTGGQSWFTPGPGHGIQLKYGPKAGRLIIPSYEKDSGGIWRSFVIYSDDHGLTWQSGGRTSQGEECLVVETVTGALYMNIRWVGTRAFTRSYDGGESWGPLQFASELIEPDCQAAVKRFTTATEQDRNRVLFSNPASTGRYNMTVRLSYDECQSWNAGKTIYSGQSAYSDLCVLPQIPMPNIVCFYERGISSPYEKITFAKFNLEWLTNGNDVPERSMRIYYNNNTSSYSEVGRTYTQAQDWTLWGTKVLSLWFRGDPNNGTEKMYVALEDNNDANAVVTYKGDANVLKQEDWQEWSIALYDFNDSGVDLSMIKKVIIGFGDRNSLIPSGASGHACVDDIRLYPCRAGVVSADFNGDCVVDFRDLGIMVEHWLDVAGDVDANGLVAHWRFDEGTGSIAYDSVGDNHGTIYGANWTVGLIDDALAFDGVEDYVLIGDADALELPELTLCFWSKNLDPTRHFDGGVGKGVLFGHGADYSYKIDFSDGSASAAITNASDDEFTLYAPIEGSNWHMWTVTAGDCNLVFYKDGIIQDSTSYTGEIDYTKTNNNFVIGARDQGGYSLYGVIDDVRIYDYAMTAQKVQQVMEGSELPNDLNNDGIVNFEDFAAMSAIWLKNK